MGQGSISIKTVTTRADVADWIAVPHRVFADDPVWVPPLHWMERRRISPSTNPFFQTADVALFVAVRDDVPVGRISAQVNRRHLEVHGDACGHFGFFDCIDDRDVADALIGTAANWLAARGMRRIAGPFSFSINEECGVAVDGFDSAAAVLMPQSRPWYARLLEQSGLSADCDLSAYRFHPRQAPAVIDWMTQRLPEDVGTISVRHMDLSRFADDLRLMIDIANDGWSGNWSFVPFSAAEIDAMAHRLRAFMRPHYARILLLNGEPAAFSLHVPNLNEIIAGFGGRLFPFNWLRLGYALGFETFRSFRVPLLGVRRQFHGTLAGSALFAALVKAGLADLEAYDLDFVELSWIVSSNRPVARFLRSAFGQPVKTYRMFKGDLPLQP